MHPKAKYVPYQTPKCTVCKKQALVYSKNKEPRCIKHQRDKPQTKICRCGAIMKIRENKVNHTFFWGCTNFPNCLETQKL